MGKSHNKKRNVGIIYEQLVTTISRSLVENDRKMAGEAIRVIKEHFKPGTELYKEFRLFNALYKTHVKSDALASRILQESKDAALKHDEYGLRHEKSMLVRDINYTFGKDFYDAPIREYKVLATIQTLLNDWRSSDVDVARRVEYESKVHDWLLEKKDIQELESMVAPDVNDLTVKLMRESFNKKFGEALNQKQKMLVKMLVFEGNSGPGWEVTEQVITETMDEQRANAIKLLNKYEKECESEHVKRKIPQAKKLLENLDTSTITDDSVVKFLSVTKLCDELMETR